jgi:hypothetical protein
VYGIIEDVEICIWNFPHIILIMNIVVIDVLYSWFILFSRSWVVALGVFLSMSLTHENIPMGYDTFNIIYR